MTDYHDEPSAKFADYCVRQFPENNEFITNVKFLSPPLFVNLSILQCNYSVTNYANELFSQLEIYCPINIIKAMPKRKAEYLAGRYLCRLLLLSYGLPPLDIPIGKDRQPLWPEGWVGSISHSGNAAICCLIHRTQNQLIGIDIENWIARSTALDISSSIINSHEYVLLSPLRTFEKIVTLAFSAKESLFKALYPVVGRYFYFDVARFIDFSITSFLFSIQIKENLSNSVMAEDVFHGYFKINKSGIITIVTHSLKIKV